MAGEPPINREVVGSLIAEMALPDEVGDVPNFFEFLWQDHRRQRQEIAAEVGAIRLHGGDVCGKAAG